MSPTALFGSGFSNQAEQVCFDDAQFHRSFLAVTLKPVKPSEGELAFRRLIGQLVGSLALSDSLSLPDYCARHWVDAPISTAFAESAVNEVLAKRMIKSYQMRWNRKTFQPFLTVRVAVLNDAIELAHRSWHVGSNGCGGIAPRFCMLSCQIHTEPS